MDKGFKTIYKGFEIVTTYMEPGWWHAKVDNGEPETDPVWWKYPETAVSKAKETIDMWE